MEEITLVNGKVVSKKDYIKLKTRDLIDFGYNLKQSEVAEQLEKVLNNDKLNVIGMFIKADIKQEEYSDGN